jgi:hypothetical protein
MLRKVWRFGWTITRLRPLMLVPLLLLASAPSFDPAYAAVPTSASGGFSEGVPSFTTRSAGGNVIVDFTADVTFTGTFSGTATSIGTEVIHPTGMFTVQAVVTCACTVGGQSGQVIFRFEATGSFASFQKQGQFVVRGIGALANLHGQGTMTQNGLGGTYSGSIHFAP